MPQIPSPLPRPGKCRSSPRPKQAAPIVLLRVFDIDLLRYIAVCSFRPYTQTSMNTRQPPSRSCGVQQCLSRDHMKQIIFPERYASGNRGTPVSRIRATASPALTNSPGCGPTTGRRCSAIRPCSIRRSAPISKLRTPTSSRYGRHRRTLRKALFDEMKGRIKEDNSSVPMKDGPYAYGSSYKKGGEQPRFFRTPRDGGAEEIILDGDAEAEGKAYFRIGGSRPFRRPPPSCSGPSTTRARSSTRCACATSRPARTSPTSSPIRPVRRRLGRGQ